MLIDCGNGDLCGTTDSRICRVWLWVMGSEVFPPFS